MALNSGEVHYRCPTCNEREEFLETSKNLGIYVPVSEKIHYLVIRLPKSAPRTAGGLLLD